jgi:hypothetical protein
MQELVELDDDRGARAARNQALFREVNERVRDLKGGRRIDVLVDDWVCECADEACSERIQLTVEEYERVRAAGHRFAVAPGNEHVVPQVEAVTERSARYWIVEKCGHAGEIAKGFDPRTRKRIRGT